MLAAQERAKSSFKVNLYTTQFEEDKTIIPDGFEVLPNLKRSVSDCNPLLSDRKLPLIADILKILEENSDAEYFIYSNADIGLMPHFYQYVTQKLNEGYDALVINRRRLNARYTKIEELPEIYADLGASHPGFDCFVFKRSLIKKFVLGDICVGISFIGVALAHNVFSLAEKPLFIPDQHLTFHIGVDVLVPRSNAFYKHNRGEFFNVVQPALAPHFELKKFPYAALAFPKRALKWILNPSLFTLNYVDLERKSFLQKCKTLVDEIRWRILQK